MIPGGHKIQALPQSLVRRLPDVALCGAPLLKVLWALRAAKLSGKGQEFATADDISELLLRSDVHLSPVRVHRALARAGDAVARRGKGESAGFRIMAEGERLLEQRAGRRGPLTLRVTGKAPWSDRRFVVKEAVKKSTGEVLIVDKYFGVESLDFLQEFQKARKIRFLTTRPSTNVGILQREIARFRREFANSEFRAYQLPHELHDRYLLFDKEVWFVGHGIKDLGRKESFVVILQDPFGKDIRRVLHDAFESRWATSPNF